MIFQIADRVSNILFIVGALTIPFLLWTFAKLWLQSRRPNGREFFFMAGPIISIVFGVSLGQALVSKCRKDLNAFLALASTGATLMSINGSEYADARGVLAAIAQLRNGPYHHSHPTKRISIAFTHEHERFEIELGRDSDISDEYWVFDPRYESTRNNNLGKIQTTVLDGY